MNTLRFDHATRSAHYERSHAARIGATFRAAMTQRDSISLSCRLLDTALKQHEGLALSHLKLAQRMRDELNAQSRTNVPLEIARQMPNAQGFCVVPREYAVALGGMLHDRLEGDFEHQAERDRMVHMASTLNDQVSASWHK